MFKRPCFSWFTMLLLLLLAACGPALAANDADASAASPAATAPLSRSALDYCPVTQPPDPAFIPPEPYAPTAPYGNFWYGANGLWTSLEPDGIWDSLPYSEMGYAQKVFWWREGYDMRTEPWPQITVSSRRLDDNGPAHEHTGGTNGYHDDLGQFMLTGAAIPTVGCWEITGQYGDESLTFVVWVAP